jgi:hypothetical protein
MTDPRKPLTFTGRYVDFARQKREGARQMQELIARWQRQGLEPMGDGALADSFMPVGDYTELELRILSAHWHPYDDLDTGGYGEGAL